MITLLAIISPVLILTLWLIYVSIKSKDWSMAICVPLFTLSVLNLFVILHLQLAGKIPSQYFLALAHWTFDWIPILAYIFICTRCNQKWYETTLLVLMAFTLLNLSPGITLYLGEETGTLPHRDDRLYLYLNGVSVFRIKLWQICMALQFIWMTGRFIIFIKKISSLHLHFSDKSKLLAISIIVVIAFAFSSLFIPDRYWFASEIPLYVTLTLVSLGLCFALYLLTKGYALTPIIDSENEPAAFAYKENVDDVWTRIQKVIVEEKLYLQPDILLSQVAQLAGTNRTYVTNAISLKAKTNFNGYINRLRVAYAAEYMALNPEKRMDEVAKLCGFTSASTFAKIFKKLTGCTPTEVRRPKNIKK